MLEHLRFSVGRGKGSKISDPYRDSQDPAHQKMAGRRATESSGTHISNLVGPFRVVIGASEAAVGPRGPSSAHQPDFYHPFGAPLAPHRVAKNALSLRRGALFASLRACMSIWVFVSVIHVDECKKAVSPDTLCSFHG